MMTKLDPITARLTAHDTALAEAFAMLLHIINADPFYATVGGFRAFRFAAMVCLNAAEKRAAGKAVYMPMVYTAVGTINDMIMTAHDTTGVLQTIFDAAMAAATKAKG